MLETTEFGEVAQNKGHYDVQANSRSPIFIPLERQLNALQLCR